MQGRNGLPGEEGQERPQDDSPSQSTGQGFLRASARSSSTSAVDRDLAGGVVWSGVLRRPLSEREHRLGDLADRRIGNRSGGLLEDEQPCPGDLARDRLAV